MSEAGKVINSIDPILELIRGNNLKSAIENILVWVDPQIADLLLQLEKAEQILVFVLCPDNVQPMYFPIWSLRIKIACSLL